MKTHKLTLFLLTLSFLGFNSCHTETEKSNEKLTNYRFSYLKLYNELETEKYNTFDLIGNENNLDSAAVSLLEFIHSIKLKVTGLKNITVDSLWQLGYKLDEELVEPNEIFDHNANGLGLQLEIKLREYYKKKLKQANSDKQLSNVIVKRIPKDLAFNGHSVFWIGQNFIHVPRIGILCNLSALQLEIINTEYQIIQLNNAR